MKGAKEARSQLFQAFIVVRKYHHNPLEKINGDG